MSAVMGTLVGIKTMADGTPRITLDLSCTLGEIAGLGSAPGTPFGLARITQQAATESAQQETIEKAKGGPLAKWAALRCKEPEFFEFIRPIYDQVMGGDGTRTGDVTPQDVGGEEGFCRHAILVICTVSSRAELDTNPEAAKVFRMRIMLPWQGSIFNPHRGTN